MTGSVSIVRLLIAHPLEWLFEIYLIGFILLRYILSLVFEIFFLILTHLNVKPTPLQTQSFPGDRNQIFLKDFGVPRTAPGT